VSVAQRAATGLRTAPHPDRQAGRFPGAGTGRPRGRRRTASARAAAGDQPPRRPAPPGTSASRARPSARSPLARPCPPAWRRGTP